MSICSEYNNSRCKANLTESKENENKEQGGENNGKQPCLMMRRVIKGRTQSA